MNKVLHVIFGLMILSGNLLGQSEVELARQYYSEGEYEKALEYVEEAEKKHGRTLYDLKLNCYLALEDYRKAENHIEDFIRNSRGNNFESYADLTYVFRKQGRDKKAESVVEDITERVQKNGGLAYGFANAFQARGYPRIALQVYEAAEASRPNSGFIYQKALLYGEVGDIRKMYESYVQMVEAQGSYLNTVKQLLGRALQAESSPESTEYIKELLIKRIQDGGPQTLNDLLVFIFIKEENFNGAFTQLKALDKRNPGNKGELFHLGKVALNNEEYILARRVFKYIIDAGNEYPFYEETLIFDLKTEKERLLSNNSTEEKHWKDLQDRYFEVIEELKGQPETGPLTIEVADISAFQLNQTDTAVAMLKKLITTGFVSREDQARGKIMLGDILLYQGERWEAIIYYGQAEKAFERSPIGQEAKFKRAKAAYYVGDFEWAQGIFSALKASTSKLIANDALHYSLLINDNIALDTNTEAMTMFARADLMNYQDKTDSALSTLNMMDIAFVDHRIQDEVLYLKSQIFIKKKRYEEAAESLRVLIQNYGDDILADNAKYMLAQLYENHLNRVPEAQELYRDLFTEHPDSFYASDARKRFRELRGDVVN